MNIVKLTALILVVIVVVNLLLFAFGKLSPLIFWIIILAAALMAFYIIPNAREKMILQGK